MKIAIIGCGNIASTHAQVLSEMGHEISLCIDYKLEISKAFSKRFNIKNYSDNFSDALAKDIEVVHICTPPVTHYEMAKACLNAGKHVFCEKPLCLDSSHALEIAALAKAKSLLNAVGFNVRYHVACQKMAEYVKSPEFGKIYLIHGSYLQEFNAFPAPLDWRYNEELAGKMRAVSEIGSHWFDLAQYVTGQKITDVSAVFGRFNPERHLEDNMMTATKPDDSSIIDVSSEDAAVIQMKFDSGAIGSTVLSEVSQGRINRLSLEITGENMSVWWNSEDNNVLHVGRTGQGIKTELFPFGNGFADTQRAMFKSFYSDVQSGKTTGSGQYPTFADACHNINLCNCSYDSSQSGSQWINVK